MKGSLYYKYDLTRSRNRGGISMNENIIKILNEQIWYLCTYSDEPNAVPVGFKMMTEDNKLIIGDVMMKTTVDNIKANGKAAISVCDLKGPEGYQIKGKAEYLSEGPIVDKLKQIAEEKFKGKMTAKGAVIITPEKVVITTPGAENKKETIL